METDDRQRRGHVSGRATDGFISSRRNYSVHTAPDSSTNVDSVASPVPPHQKKHTVPSHTPVHHQPVTLEPLLAKDNIIGPELPTHFDMPKYIPPKHPLSILRRKRSWMRVMAQGVMVTLGVVLIGGGFLFWRGYTNLHRVFQGNGTVAALSTQAVAPDLLKGEGDGRVNILLLGIGGKNHPGGDLTDTIMVFSVDPVNNKAAMLSVPRDMWVKMPVNYFGAYQKLNAAYSSGKYKSLGRVDLSSDNQQAVEAGFESVDTAVGDVLGININYNVLVDFQAFEQAVNTVDGVTVDVKQQLYDPTMAWENGNNPVLAPVGTQNMNGKEALLYARSRETSSDFARAERQRELIVALKQKVLSLGTLSSPTRIDGLMNAFGDNVRTDLSTTAANRLYTIMKRIGDSDISSLSLTAPESLVTTDRVGDASVVRPKAGFDTYSDIQTYVRSQLRDGYLIKEHAGVYVVGANTQLEQHTVDTLKDYGYSVVGSTTAQGLPAGTTIVDLTDGSKPYTQHYLQDRYGISAITSLPKSVVDVPTDAQFVIIAGI